MKLANLESSAPAAMISYALGDGAHGEATLSPLPFVIGRAESANLMIPSSRLSREHAVLSWEGSAFWIRDLGSTNGTFVNGQRVDRRQLAGDESVRLADIELRLQVLGVHLDPERLVTRLRSWQELQLQRGVALTWSSVASLQSGQAVATTLEFHGEGLCGVARWPDGALRGARTSESLHWISVIRAAERASWESAGPLFVAPQGVRELGRWLPILSACSGSRTVAVVVENSRQAEQVALCGMSVAWRLLPGAPRPELAGEYWLLDETFAANIAHDETRWLPLTETAEAARQRGVVSIVAGLADQEAAQICGDLGCEWGRGPLFDTIRGAATDVAGD